MTCPTDALMPVKSQALVTLQLCPIVGRVSHGAARRTAVVTRSRRRRHSKLFEQRNRILNEYAELGREQCDLTPEQHRDVVDRLAKLEGAPGGQGQRLAPPLIARLCSTELDRHAVQFLETSVNTMLQRVPYLGCADSDDVDNGK